MIEELSVLGGQNKEGHPEDIRRLDVRAGEVIAVVGPTGSGKTQLISDIEQYAEEDTPTRRSILINGKPASGYFTAGSSRRLIAEVSQKMNFVIDSTVEEFIKRHARIRGIEDTENSVRGVLAVTNELAGDPVLPADNLTSLSGGQTRALMVGDVALISNAPVVLIDEIENAGIDRLRALEILSGQRKIVLVVTHDLTLALMARRRIVMKNGGMYRLHTTTPDEERIMAGLIEFGKDVTYLRDSVKNGESILIDKIKKENKTLWREFCCIAPLT